MNRIVGVCTALLFTVLAVCGQETANGVALNRIPGAESITIPPGLSDAQAIEAIARTAVGIGNWLTGRWVVESRDPSNKWIRVALTVRQHAMTVCYRVENGKLVPDVPQSTNLRQDGSKIDGHVPGWINRFNNRVVPHFAEVAKSAATNVPVPAPVATPAPAKTESAAPASAVRFCEGCGKKVSADANFCGSCGRKIR